jgi:superfamily II DNA or RNA helicase
VLRSGKTFLAAFDARNFDSKRLLYVVHKDIILAASMQPLKRFLEQIEHMDFIQLLNKYRYRVSFATNTMMANHLEEFDPHQFDYIIIDEAHHAAADTYKAIIEYFKPSFYWG